MNVTGDGVTLSTPERQWFQANGIPEDEDLGEYWLSDGYMRHEMSSWVYPHHFIDFATAVLVDHRCPVASEFHTHLNKPVLSANLA